MGLKSKKKHSLIHLTLYAKQTNLVTAFSGVLLLKGMSDPLAFLNFNIK